MPYHNLQGKNGYVYILSNFKRNVLYTGVTSELIERIWDHKTRSGSKFTRKYKVKYLVYVEEHPNIEEAIQREKQLNNWKHQWKLNLIKQQNPSLKDLWDEIK